MGEFFERWWPSLLGVTLLLAAGVLLWPENSGPSVSAETSSSSAAPSGTPMPAVGSKTQEPDIDRRHELEEARRRADLKAAERERNGEPPADSPSQARVSTAEDLVRPVTLTQDSPEVRRALRLVEVELYETTWCKYCRKTRAFLDRSGISYRAYDIEADETAKSRRDRLAPGRGVPLTVVDGQTITGFSEQALSAAFQSAIQRRLAAR